MGLDIYFGNLESTLADQYVEFPRPRTTMKRALKLLAEEIRRQGGDASDLSEKNVPRKYTRYIRYGSYSAIHTLRVYACRIAGYTLERAYALPERHIGVLGPSEDEDEDGNQESATFSDNSVEAITEEHEIEQYWQLDLNDICPMPDRPEMPFPFAQLVCFSDT